MAPVFSPFREIRGTIQKYSIFKKRRSDVCTKYDSALKNFCRVKKINFLFWFLS